MYNLIKANFDRSNSQRNTGYICPSLLPAKWHKCSVLSVIYIKTLLLSNITLSCWMNSTLISHYKLDIWVLLQSVAGIRQLRSASLTVWHPATSSFFRCHMAEMSHLDGVGRNWSNLCTACFIAGLLSTRSTAPDITWNLETTATMLDINDWPCKAFQQVIRSPNKISEQHDKYMISY